jgi:MFS family permease
MTSRDRGVVLALMCGTVFMTVVDLSVVNTALPSIGSALHVDTASLQWVVVVYGVTTGGFLLVGGRAGDRHGHKSMLVTGLLLLTVGSLAAGLASSLAALLVARAAQGLGSALAAPNTLAILARTFPAGPERNRAMGILGAAGGTAATLGSVLGGAVTQAAGWHWAFLINVPVGLSLALLVLGRVAADRPSPAIASNVVGAVMLTSGLMALTLGIHESVVSGASALARIAPAAGGLVLLAACTATEAKARAPLMPRRLVGRRELLAAAAIASLLWGAFFGFIFEATLFTQRGLGYTPLQAGAAGLTIALVSLSVSGAITPRVIDRIGARGALSAGLALMAAAWILLTRAPSRASYWIDLFGPYALLGVGIGLAQVAVQIAAFAKVTDSAAGIAGGVIETASELGGALGVAATASVAFAVDGAGPRHGVALTAAFHTVAAVCAVIATAASFFALWTLRPNR